MILLHMYECPTRMTIVKDYSRLLVWTPCCGALPRKLNVASPWVCANCNKTMDFQSRYVNQPMSHLSLEKGSSERITELWVAEWSGFEPSQVKVKIEW